MVLPWYDFPGWTARLDDRPLPLSRDAGGLLELTVPAGPHRVAVWFGTIAPRVWGWILAAIAAGALLAWFIVTRPVGGRFDCKMGLSGLPS